MSDTPNPVKLVANEGADMCTDAPSFEDDVQMVVSVQISHQLHPQLFDDLARVKKRERAERVRWLCQYGLAAERQALANAHSVSIDDVPTSTRELLRPTRDRESHLTQPRFAHPDINRFEGGTNDAPSIMSHPDVSHLLL